MKKFLLASAGVLAIGVVSASAADLPRQRPMPANAPVHMAPPYNWTGFYVGLNGGGGFGSSDISAPVSSGSYDTSGALVGGTLGYNYQMGQVVFGLEGDAAWSSIRGSGPCAGTTCETRNNWLSTVRGRLGYAIDRFMPYVTGGAAFGDIKTSIAGIGDTRETKAGWTVGGGIEAAITGPWTAKVEYLHVDLGDTGTAVPGANANFHTDIVRGGINYRF
jgi:outer membrane immunogenic protein